MRAVMFLIGLVIGIGLGWATFLVLTNQVTLLLRLAPG